MSQNFRRCKNCKTSCLLLPVSCMLEEDLIFDLQETRITAETINRFMDLAQTKYIIPIIQQDCFEELCSVLSTASTYQDPYCEDQDDPVYTIDEKWVRLLDALTPLLRYGTEYLYITRTAIVGKITKNGITFPKIENEGLFNMFLKGRKTELLLAEESFKEFMEQNKDDYPCYKSPKKTYKDQDTFSVIQDWDTTKSVDESPPWYY